MHSEGNQAEPMTLPPADQRNPPALNQTNSRTSSRKGNRHAAPAVSTTLTGQAARPAQQGKKVIR